MPHITYTHFNFHRETLVLRAVVQVLYVQPRSPAHTPCPKTPDKLLTVTAADGEKHAVTSASELPKITKEHIGQKVQLTYVRDGVQQQATAQLRTVEQAKGGKAYLGVSPAELSLTRATWSAPVQAVGMIGQLTEATFKGLGTAISALFQGDTTKASEQVSGPVGIVVVLRDGSLLGFQYILLIIGVISLSLAIMNVLPIPALDGGRFYVILLSRIFGKKLSKDMEERIVGASFVFLLLLIVLITIVDVKRFF
jgi:regulator of sigma E protease